MVAGLTCLYKSHNSTATYGLKYRPSNVIGGSVQNNVSTIEAHDAERAPNVRRLKIYIHYIHFHVTSSSTSPNPCMHRKLVYMLWKLIQMPIQKFVLAGFAYSTLCI